MPIQVRERVRRHRRSEFDLRRTALGFALVAVLLCGAGLAFRAALESAERHPVVAGVSVAALVAAAAGATTTEWDHARLLRHAPAEHHHRTDRNRHRP
ncbi:hypothetical protein ACWD63_18630, partial [Streptomyces clavifer]